jgi:DNA (cytosine-5)-methyltransferase 1
MSISTLPQGEAPVGVQESVRAALQAAYAAAQYLFDNDLSSGEGLSDRFRNALDVITANSIKASAVFTNVVTGMAVKLAEPTLDVRYHQVQIQNPKRFNLRGLSEQVVYPWLASQDFDGAKSGWQTRTLERPKPYMLDYDENISRVKDEFLTCYDEIYDSADNAREGLAYLIFQQMRLREEKRIELANPAIDDINQIVSYFWRHFSHSYTGRGPSRLPVLALYAVYQIITQELHRYAEKELQLLESHSAADSQTGAAGDIEVNDRDGAKYEAVEVKHGQRITMEMVDDAARKIAPYKLNRFYLLTTHPECRPDEAMQARLDDIRAKIGCQIIVNGVLPTLQYYLRLTSDPSQIFTNYTQLLQFEKAISHEQLVAWNEIVIGTR